MVKVCYLCGNQMQSQYGTNIGSSGRWGIYYQCTGCGRVEVPQE